MNAFLSGDQEQAARLAVVSVLEGDLPNARRWALEYAVHRDGVLTDAERAVILEGWRVREESWEAQRLERHRARLAAGGLNS